MALKVFKLGSAFDVSAHGGHQPIPGDVTRSGGGPAREIWRDLNDKQHISSRRGEPAKYEVGSQDGNALPRAEAVKVEALWQLQVVREEAGLTPSTFSLTTDYLSTGEVKHSRCIFEGPPTLRPLDEEGDWYAYQFSVLVLDEEGP